MPFVPSVEVPPLEPGAQSPGSGYAVPPSRVAGVGTLWRQTIEAGTGITLTAGAVLTVALDTAYTAGLYAALAHTHPQSEVTNLVSDLATLSAGLAAAAPLASPTFTGTPAAPTAAPGTNTTQLATTAFVTAAVAAIGGGSAAATTFAPAAGIAATDVQAAIEEVVSDVAAAYAPLASPTFTGTPAAPTAAGGTNTTQVATTAFVTGALGSYLTTASAASTYAPLASPTFTGTPAAPTAAAATNTTQLATTAFVQTAVGDYVAKAGSTMTGKLNLPASLATGAYLNIGEGTHLTSGWVNGDVWLSATQGLSYRIGGATQRVAVREGATFTGYLVAKASDASEAFFRIPHGVDPGFPTNGDLWTTTAGLFVRINGATVGPLGAGGGGTAATTSFTPASGLSSTDVQAAIEEVMSVTAATYAPIISPDFESDVQLTAAAGTTRLYTVRTAGSMRWGWGADNSAESGSEAGSDFVLRAFTDAGVYYGDAFQVDRATLETAFWEKVTFDGDGINIPHSSAPASPVNGDIWTTTSGMYVRINGATVGPLSSGGSFTGGTLTSPLITAASTTTGPSIRIPNATSAPSSPTEGDIWKTTNALVVRHGGNSLNIATEFWVDQNYLDAEDPQPGGTMYFHGGVAAYAPINIDPSAPTDPTSPSNGDLWYNGGLKFREAGVTETIAFLSDVTGGGMSTGKAMALSFNQALR